MPLCFLKTVQCFPGGTYLVSDTENPGFSALRRDWNQGKHVFFNHVNFNISQIKILGCVFAGAEWMTETMKRVAAVPLFMPIVEEIVVQHGSADHFTDMDSDRKSGGNETAAIRDGQTMFVDAGVSMLDEMAA